MSVIYMPQFRSKKALPIVAFIDLQVEYVSEGRAYHIWSAPSAVRNCQELLTLARQARLPIAHFRLLDNGAFFNQASEFSHWIEGVKPRPNEYVYERSLPSCFSNMAFCELMGSIEAPQLLIAGLSGDRTCLSTAIDGFHRNCHVTYIQDCSATAAIGTLNEKQSHEVVNSLMSIYSEVECLQNISHRMGRFGTLSSSG